MQYSQRENLRITSEIILGVVFLACGCTIYLLFRSKSLNIYQWCFALGLSNFIDILREHVISWNIPIFVRYSLPDGLYSAAYIVVIDAIWYNVNRIQKYAIVSFIPFIATCNEVLQHFGLVKGTFDLYDLLCYTLPLLIYLSIKVTKNRI